MQAKARNERQMDAKSSKNDFLDEMNAFGSAMEKAIRDMKSVAEKHSIKL